MKIIVLRLLHLTLWPLDWAFWFIAAWRARLATAIEWEGFKRRKFPPA